MGIIQEKPIVGVVIVIVVLGIVGYVMFSRSSTSVEPGSRFYYDVSSGEMVTFKANEPLPPVTLPSGKEGVLAHVYACGDCSSEQFVGYLQKFTDEYKQIVTRVIDPSQSTDPVVRPMTGELVAANPDAGGQPKWIEMNSEAGTQIIRAVRERCAQGQRRPENPATECFPQ